MSSYKKSWLEATVMAGTILLAITAAFKLCTFFLLPSEIDLMDPILHMRESRLHLIVGSVEIGVVIAVLGTSSVFLRGIILATVGAQFLWYHAALWLVGWRGRCPCLGSAWAWIGLSDRVAENAAIAIAFMLFLIGLVTCIHGSRHRSMGPA